MPLEIEFPEKLLFLINSPARLKILYGGRGAGKTENCARALIILACQKKLRIACFPNGGGGGGGGVSVSPGCATVVTPNPGVTVFTIGVIFPTNFVTTGSPGLVGGQYTMQSSDCGKNASSMIGCGGNSICRLTGALH
jgi:hypothetical protein